MRKKLARMMMTALACALALGCNKIETTHLGGSDGPAVIFPDYKDVTIPVNIAPLNYYYAMKGATGATTTFSVDGKSITIKGVDVEWKLSKWKAFIADAAGKDIEVNAKVKVNGKTLEDSWTISVIGDEIDAFLTYRRIEPAFQMTNEVSIMERNVENFEENTICDYTVTGNSCMNCHIHGQQRGDLSMFYIRGPKGGAILNRDGMLRKLTLKTPDMISGTVYGELHPSGRFGVFSTNIIWPGLHSMYGKRTEVYDTVSDLTVADFDDNRMINLPQTARADKLETFPCFSADGNTVFYCSADTLRIPEEIDNLRYSLVSVPFNSETGEMGTQMDTLWNAETCHSSVCHPKASPDGRWLMFTVSDFGTFPINHNESTLHMIDLQTGEVNALESIKAETADTFHSWSSDSRWFVFASKRGDSQYSKAFFCHLDENGNPTKPFMLPQKDARYYDNTLKSFNVPDLGKASTGITKKDSKAMYNAKCEVFE